MAVQVIVNGWKARGDESPVRYYKKVGDCNEDTKETQKSPFKKEDFLLVFQSPQQAEMMVDNPRTLCVDATHGLTGYDYYLLTILVVDECGHGLPVGWSITSRENSFIWKLFGKSLRPNSLACKPEVLMADDDNSAWNGLKPVWPTLKYKLLCHWHVKQNVRKHCLGSKAKIQVSRIIACCTSSHMLEYPPYTPLLQQMPEQSPSETSESVPSLKCIDACKHTYGTPVWQMFFLLMREEDKETFFNMLGVLRKTLKLYRQDRLLQYFEERYFSEERIKQWAKWFRQGMYGCKWLLDTNMHVESWHNYLKTHLMCRLKNVRVDKLLRVLVQAEVVYFWKWSRTALGAYERVDPAWKIMHGHVAKSSMSVAPLCVDQVPMPTRKEVARKSYKETLVETVAEIQRLIKCKCLPLERQRAVLQQLNSVKHVLRHEATYGQNVITTPAFVTTDTKSERVIPQVAKQYQFKRKRSRAAFVRTNVKAFKGSSSNRHNHFLSFQMGCGTASDNFSVTPLKTKLVALQVQKSRKTVTLGGITFMPSIGGIVIGEHMVDY